MKSIFIRGRSSEYCVDGVDCVELPGKRRWRNFRRLASGDAANPRLDFRCPKICRYILWQATTKILKSKGELKLNISDLLNQKAHYYHDLDSNNKYGSTSDALALSRNYGTNVSITFGYNFK